MFAAKYATSGLLRTSKSLLAKPALRTSALRPMTVLSKESAQEYKQQVKSSAKCLPLTKRNFRERWVFACMVHTVKTTHAIHSSVMSRLLCI